MVCEGTELWSLGVPHACSGRRVGVPLTPFGDGMVCNGTQLWSSGVPRASTGMRVGVRPLFQWVVERTCLVCTCKASRCVSIEEIFRWGIW
jgi:hypothetical protein